MFSIIIPTLGRSDAYEECRESIWKQTYQDYEIIKITEEGSLAALRNKGSRMASKRYLVFIDDDVVCSPRWLSSLKSGLDRGFAGVSGPAVIKRSFRRNRDCFRLPTSFFSERIPGKISKWGMWSLAATKEKCKFEGEVDYLEACNMAFDRKAFWEVGGFDERFSGIGDWSEPDLCFRLRKAGFKLWFSRDAVVEHRPSKSGAYKKRLVKCDRMENYELFSRRWIQPGWRHSFYKFLIRGYFAAKERGLI